MTIRPMLIWSGVTIAIAVPILMAATSPLLAWRDWIYIAAGFAGIVALALLLMQPLLAGGYLPGLSAQRGRRLHRSIGATLVFMVMAHVAGLWLTSAPDVIDALLFESPTPFSAWGVMAMWAVFATALLAALRKPFRIGVKSWRILHAVFAIIIVFGSIMHAVLIEGAMGPLSKAALCALVFIATVKVWLDLRLWMFFLHRKR